MRTLSNKLIFTLFASFFLVAFSGCSKESRHLSYTLKAAGDNKSELKAVLKHYKDVDPNPEKLAAAKYLIINMPAHFSYKTDSIKAYYDLALKVFKSGMSVDAQRDSLKKVSYIRFNKSTNKTIPDYKIITSEFLIHNIDQAYDQWKNRPWAKHLTFDVFCEWLLPYKETEKQELDDWRVTFSSYFSDSISKFTYADEKESTIYHTIDVVRDEINNHKVIPHIYWTSSNGISFLSTETMLNMTFGACSDYVAMGVLGFRSLGLPAVVDYVPAWGRNSSGHTWYVFLDDRGREQATVNSLIMPAGIQFYPYERIPKVFRNTYSINWRVAEYREKTKYKHPFKVTDKDVTDRYNRTKDLVIPINDWSDKSREKVRIKEKYAYIAMFNGQYTEWQVLDFGKIKHGKAYFEKMGCNMLYIVLGFDGKILKPVSKPFILDKSGIVRYIDDSENSEKKSVTLFRKYYQSYNDVMQRNKLSGAQIQYADKADFSDCHTVLTIDDVNIPDKMVLNVGLPHKYWRYLAADGTNGSIAELAFFDKDLARIEGTPICSQEDQNSARNAFDNNWLTNYETPWDKPDGAWVGMSFEDKVAPEYVRVVPRGDGNDIVPGDIYELKYFVGGKWISAGKKKADDNRIVFEYVPVGRLMWLSDLSGGIEERPFLIDENNEITWW